MYLLVIRSRGQDMTGDVNPGLLRHSTPEITLMHVNNGLQIANNPEMVQVTGKMSTAHQWGIEPGFQ